jgi:hypothetical protein
MLYALVVVLIIGCAAFMMNEGLHSAAIILVCTIFGGLFAFNFFEPLAAWLESRARFLEGYGDILCLTILFTISVTVLRLVTEQLCPTMAEFPDLVHRGGGLLVGAWLGWVVSGIFIAALQTLPLHQNFMGYDYRKLEGNSGWNADRYWLAFVHRVSADVFDHEAGRNLFDRDADFAIRYHLFRRVNDEGKTQLAAGEASRASTSRASRGAPRGRE